ncbi:MAG TPA: hypothetical protein VI911_10440 [Patescibacteria group bacterium]|nr:hypothetical protein [Patescibacteria group bacterium]
MNIGPDTFEKAIAVSCIQLARAYSVTDKIGIEDAKVKVGKYLNSLKIYKGLEENEDHYDPTSHFRTIVSLAIQTADNNHEKAYLELLKIREILN